MPLANENGAVRKLRAGSFLLLAALPAAILVVWTGFRLYEAQRESEERAARDEVLTIASLKAAEVSRWRSDILADASLLSTNPHLGRLAEQYGAEADPAKARAILESIVVILSAVAHGDVVFTDRGGRPVTSRGNADDEICKFSRAAMLEAARFRRPRLTDLHRPEPGAKIHLVAVAPLFGGENSTGPLSGFVLFQVNPESALYPMLSRWPLPSGSGDILLVRREGAGIMCLSEPRGATGVALNLAISLAHANLPAVMAARGRIGAVEGRDWRGVPVFAGLVPVPDSGWFVVAKKDKSEAHASLAASARLIPGFVAGLLLALAAAAGMAGQRERKRRYRDLYLAQLDRQRAEEALAASEEKFLLMAERISDVLFRLDSGGVITYVSPAVRDMFGFEPEDVVGRHYTGFVGEKTRETADAAFFEMIRAGRANTVLVLSMKRKDGAEFFAEFNARRYESEAGPGALGVIRDVSERIQTLDALSKRTAELEAILDSMSEAVIFSDAERRIVMVNRAFTRMWGYEPAEVKGLCTKQLYADPEDYGNMGRARYNPEAGSSDQVAELLFRRKDGGVFPTETLGGPVRDAQGNLLGYVGIHRDISERKKTRAALRESEERFRRLAESAPVGIYEMNAAGDFVYVNKTWCEMAGMTPEETRGRGWLSAYHPEDREAIAARLERLLTDPSPAGGNYRFRTSDGRVRRVETFCVALLNEKGEVTGRIGTTIDVTARKQAEEERLELERRLLQGQKMESLGVLAGGIAHDFNNLLMAILGNLDLALYDLPANSGARFSIEESSKAANRAADLTRQMLAYSGKGRFLVRSVSLSEIVEEQSPLLRAAVPRTCSLHFRLYPGLAAVEADAAQVQQVVMNLVVNSGEAVGEAPGSITIATGIMHADAAYLAKSRLAEKPEPGRFVWLEVTDNGCGMDEETLEKLFDPFFTTKFMGRGLGMSAVMGIARGHGGAILVESEKGRGATVRVLFPAGGEAAIEAPGPFAAPPPNGRAAGLYARTVLLAEDEEMVRSIVKVMLERLGLSVIMARDGVEAVEIFRRRCDEIHLVILDLSMPRMDGAAAFSEMRSIRPTVPVILSSGYGEEEAAARVKEAGLAGFIRKPYEMKALKSAVYRALDESVEDAPAPPETAPPE